MMHATSFALTLALAVGSPSVTALADATPGKPAPDFAATDATGATHTLSSYRGKVVVLEWSNHDCPYVRKHYGSGNMQALQSQAAKEGVVWLTVVSSAPGRQGYVEGLEAQKLTEDREAKPSAVLLDAQGSVGRLYGARTTPHMFVIDKAGNLAYAGAIDDRPSASRSSLDGARNYVSEALAALRESRPLEVAATRAYGCSIKYR